MGPTLFFPGIDFAPYPGHILGMTWLYIILWIMIGVSSLLAGLTTLLFYYDNYNTYGPEELHRRTGVSMPVLFLRTLGQTLLSQLIVSVTYPFGYIKPLWFRPPDVAIRQPRSSNPGHAEPRPPVLLIHGLYHNASAWVYMKYRLRQAGYEHIFAYSYFSFFQDFFHLTRVLANKVEELRSYFPDTKLVLMGHSLGALTIRAYMASLESQDKIAAAVALAAPHQGSRLAALGFGGLARSLMYKGELITALEQADQPASAPCLSIASPVDEFVLPLDATFLPRAQELGWTEQTGPSIPHVSLLFSPKTADMSLAFLDKVLAEN